MARFDGGWCQFPRSVLALTKRDPLARALFITLCAWANIEKSQARNGAKIIVIEKGQVLTSAEELAADLGSERRVIMRKLKFLAEAGVINIGKGYRGYLISILHLGLDMVSYVDSIEDRTNLSDTKETSKVCAPYGTPCGTPPVTRIQEKEKEKERGEYARARDNEGPPPKISKSDSGSDMGKDDAPPEGLKALPEEGKRLKLRWLVRIHKFARNIDFTDEKIDAEILKMAELYSWRELNIILNFLDNSTHKVAKEFITPFDHHKKFFNQGTLIQVALIEAMSSPEGKALIAKQLSDAREAEKKAKAEEEERKHRENDPIMTEKERKQRNEERFMQMRKLMGIVK